jgi:hypothetical protein
MDDKQVSGGIYMVHVLPLTILNVFTFAVQKMCAVPDMAVFCIFLIPRFPRMLLGYFLNDFEMIPVDPIITGITCVFAFQICCISILGLIF